MFSRAFLSPTFLNRQNHYIFTSVLAARENAPWDYDRIQGALNNLGHIVAPSMVWNILKRHGIEPAPEREKRSTWKTFLKAHWDVMAATDFFTVEV